MYPFFFQSRHLGIDYHLRKGAANLPYDQTTLFAKVLISNLRKSIYVVLATLLIVALTACNGDSSGKTLEVVPTETENTTEEEQLVQTVSYTITASANSGGSIAPTSITVTEGNSTEFTLTADSLYRLVEVSGCDGNLSGNTYTTSEIHADCTITANFSLIPPVAPTLSLTPKTIKTFSFSWADVSDETEYRLLENPDGASGFTQIATLAADTIEHDLLVLLPARINASYMLQACNSGGCSDSNTVNVSGSLTEEIGYVKASNTDAGDIFGYSVALSGDGNTLAMGAPYEDSNTTINGAQDDNNATNSGAVYVFYRDGHTWTQQAYIKASNANVNNQFGSSLAFSNDGNTLAVGAALAGQTVTGSGAAYIYTRVGTTWSEQAIIEASNPASSDYFGHSIALSGDGNTLAVGAIWEDGDDIGIDGDNNDNATNSGAIYLFTRTGTTWLQQAYVKASNTGVSDNFGSSVALSDDGTTLAVGAWSENGDAVGIDGADNDNANDSGAVYLFANEGGNWSQQAYIKASNTEAWDEFGHAVALSADGNTLAVSAPGEDNEFGTDGTANNNSAEDSGAVYLFTRSGTTWSQQAYLKASNAETGGQFGYSLALSDDGNILTVGATGETSSATGIDGDQNGNGIALFGAAYLFTRNNGQWSQQAYIKAPNAEADDAFGYSMALDGSGNTLAISAESEASGVSGINGDQTDNSASYSGAVYLY